MPIEEKDFHVFEPGRDDSFYAPRDLKWITGTKYYFSMSSSFSEHAQLKRWCLENCRAPVAYVEERYGRDINLYFFDAEDLTATKLAWGQ